MKVSISYLYLSILTISFCYALPIKPHRQHDVLHKRKKIESEWNKLKTYLVHVPLQSLEITIPKSGTHLLSKCVDLLQDKKVKMLAKKPEGRIVTCCETTRQTYIQQHQSSINTLIRINLSNQGNAPENRRISLHLPYTAERQEFVKQAVKKVLFLIRDPRDQLISFAHWVCPSSKINTQDFQNLLLDFIDGKKRTDVYIMKMQGLCNMMWTFGIAEVYKLYLPWMDVDHVYTVRFEDLVGEQGGGSHSAQIKEIKAIAHHLNLPVTNAKIHEVARNLFGGTTTFNKGQIGTWKTVFTPEHKAAFKQAAGQLLIDLGYEKDLNW